MPEFGREIRRGCRGDVDFVRLQIVTNIANYYDKLVLWALPKSNDFYQVDELSVMECVSSVLVRFQRKVWVQIPDVRDVHLSERGRRV